MRFSIASLLALACSALALVPPAQDDFYAVPSNIADYKPGQIIRHRPPPTLIGAFYWSTDLKDSHQVLYRTTDGQGLPTATVVTIMIPPNTDYKAILSFQIAEDALSPNCGPSFGIQLGSEFYPKYKSATTGLELLMMEVALKTGWIVITPDFQGPTGSFVDTLLAAQATLDGIRATLQSGSLTGIYPDSVVAMYGYSGGASVTRGASAVAPLYAPELNISGTVIGGLAPDNVSPQSLDKMSGTKDAGLIPLSLLGVAKASPAFNQFLLQQLLPQFIQTFYEPLDMCLDGIIATFKNVDVKGMFRNWPLVENVVLQLTAASAHTAAPSVPSGPTYVYQSAYDELTPITEVETTVNTWCKAGRSVRLQINTNPRANHVLAAFLGVQDAFDWLTGIRYGLMALPQCTFENAFIDAFPQRLLNTYPLQFQNALKALVAAPK